MASPTYNCPFSANAAGAAAADDSLTCAQLLALNASAGCALYNKEQEECNFRLSLARNIELGGIPLTPPTATP